MTQASVALELETHADVPVTPSRRPTPAQRAWLKRGLSQPGNKLPLFDLEGRRVNSRIIRACIEYGWAEPWFSNPLKTDWLVCRLTDAGRVAVDPPGNQRPG